MAKDIATFIDQLGRENEIFFSQLPESAIHYWHGEMSPEEAVRALQVRWFNELRGVDIIGRFVSRVPDLTLKVLVGRQVGDEAKHAKVCRRRIAELGGDVRDFRPTARQLEFGDFLDSLVYPEEFFAAQQFTVETQSLQRNERALECFDAKTAQMFRTQINPDERFHVALGHLGLRAFARTTVAQQRAADAAARVRDIHSAMVMAHRAGAA
jgi:1,2-phenylacetyl-CoA epoxidase catalytic subunit